MASIHRRTGSPFWWGAFMLPDGRRAFRSTKCTVKNQALRVCMEWEEIAKSRKTEGQIRRVMSDLCQHIHGRPLDSSTVRDYADRWISAKVNTTSKATLAAYQLAKNDLLAFLGDRQHAELGSITTSEITKCRDQWAMTGAPKTANNKLKALRVMFQCAWRDSVIIENPAAKVELVKDPSKNDRRALKLDEVKKILTASHGEWKGVVLAGIYTGQRLADIVRLRWNQVDLLKPEISLRTAKTNRQQIIPIAEALLVWLNSCAGDDATGPVFPELHGKLERGGTSPLSQRFHEILVAAGMATERKIVRDGSGPGRRTRRPRGEITFHSLRHTATSWLKDAGVSEAVARDIIGHDSAEVSRHYTHMAEDTKRAAVALLPRL